LSDEDDWQLVQEVLEVRLVEYPQGKPGERYVLRRSGARAQKERAMLERQSERLGCAALRSQTGRP
jgi:hypothetical protein